MDARHSQRCVRRAPRATPRPGEETDATASGALSSVPGHGRCSHRLNDPCSRAGLVADLRLTASRYPADLSLRRLIEELSAQSPRFVALWESGEVAPPQANWKAIEHPDVGRIRLDCDVLTIAHDDLRIMVFTAEPGTQDAERLALALVLGTQRLVP